MKKKIPLFMRVFLHVWCKLFFWWSFQYLLIYYCRLKACEIFFMCDILMRENLLDVIHSCLSFVLSVSCVKFQIISSPAWNNFLYHLFYRKLFMLNCFDKIDSFQFFLYVPIMLLNSRHVFISSYKYCESFCEIFWSILKLI